METVALTVQSPKVALPGLDHLIERMERADALITKLEKPGTIRIRFSVTGDEALQVAATNLDSLAQAFKAVGEVKIGDNIAKGLTTPGEAAKYTAAEVEKLKLRFKELNETAVTTTAKFQSQSAYSATDLEKLASRRKAIEGIIGERNAVQQRIEGLERAGGMATAMAGGIQQTAGAERALVAPVNAAAGALENQDAIVRAKIAAMQGLTAATERTAAAERAQATASTDSARANAQSALLSEKIVRDREGEEVDRIRRMRTGAGQTLTTSNAGTVESSDLVQAHRRAFEQIDAEFAGRKAMLAEQGFAPGSGGQLELLRQEAAARSQRVAAMQAEGLGAESLAEKQRTLAASLEATAHAGEQRNLRRDVGEAEASGQRRLTDGLREQIALIDRQYEATRGAARGELELAQAARQRAQEYRATAGDVRQAETMGGLNQDATRESYLRGIETKAARLEAQAQQVEQRIAAAQQANAAASRQFEQEFAAFGGKDKRSVEEKEVGGGRVVKQTASRANPVTGDAETLTWVRRYGAANEELESKLTKTTNAVKVQGNAFVQHIATAATWITAYAAIGKSVQLLNFGFDSAVKFERQFATLQTVFRGTNAEALQLGVTSLKLGAAEGRAGDEAGDAAVRWSRLGLSKREATEAVDVSLQAANVAEISAAEGAEHLSAIYAAYRLEVGDLRTVLNELNTVSNTLNVTNKDLLQGIARTGSVAKQAGVPLAELIGLIGAGVSRTGRSGAEIGNALKSTIVAISNPEIQDKLQGIFDFNVKTPLGELKDMSQVLSELYVKVEAMDGASRGELLQKLGGKQQASRLQAIFEGYVTAQVKAIEAQKDMNSTERESALIRGTVVSQLQSMTTEFQRLFYVMLSVGGEQSALGTLRNLIGLVTKLEGSLADNSWIARLLGGAADVSGIGSTINGAARLFGNTGRQSDEIGLYNRQLEDTKGQAGAAELSERLADSLSRAIAATAARDPKAADQALREFATVTGGDAKERNLTAEELVQLREENRLRELEAKLQSLSAGFGEKKRAAQEAVAVQTRETLAMEEQHAALLQKQIGMRQMAGKDTRDLERQLAEAKAEIDRLKGQGRQKLLRDYGDDEGFDPLDVVKKKFADRSKIGFDAQQALFGSGVGDTEGDKLDRKLQALAAEEAAVERMSRQKDAAFATFPKDAVDFQGNALHSAAEITAQEQLNVAITAEVAARREAIAAEREKIGILRETARIQDEIAAGTREGKNRTIANQIGRNDTEQNIAEVGGIGGLIGNTGSDARGQGEAIAYGNRLLEIQASLGERRYRLERDIANARAAQNAEASKALQMASREDQLRAALLARFTRDNGPISAEQFQFLDQDTKGAAKLVPDATAATGGKTQELEAEKAVLDARFEQVNATINTLLEGLRKAVDPGLLLKGAGSAAPPPPQITPPNVTFNMGAQFEEMTKGLYALAEGRIGAEMDGIRAQVNAFLGSQRVTRAQGGGASSINT